MISINFVFTSSLNDVVENAIIESEKLSSPIYFFISKVDSKEFYWGSVFVSNFSEKLFFNNSLRA